MHKDQIAGWWFISVGTIVAAYQGLALFGDHPTVQRVSKKLGVGRIVAWISRYPPWQSSGVKRFGRIGAMALGLAFIAWGVLEASAANPAIVRSLIELSGK